MKISFEDRPQWMATLTVFAVTVGFALYADHAWEDWYITFRASKNLALGYGLVFTPGEHVHSFTSPLGTLIPALLSFVVGPSNDDAVLWLFRLIGALLLGLAAWAVYRIARNAGAGVGVGVGTALLAAADARVINFATNGMETAFVAAFLALNLLVLTAKLRRFVLWLGVTWAALMWTRPDAMIYFGAISLGWLIFVPVSDNYASRAELLRKMVFAGLLALALYAPWVIWATWFYGSPIPHTVIAKGLSSHVGLERLLAFPERVATFRSSVEQVFMAPRGFGGWPTWMPVFSWALGIATSLYWLAPWARKHARALSFALLPCHVYLTSVSPTIAAWYVAIVSFLTCICLGLMLADALAALEGKRWRFAALGAAAAVGAFSLWSTIAIAQQARTMQILVEDGHRRQIGLWLRSSAAPGDTVFIECLGYVGFFSGLKMFDYPGLSSPEVVEARRALLLRRNDSFAGVISVLKPDWVVLRPHEAEQVRRRMPGLIEQHYRLETTFDARSEVMHAGDVPGIHALIFDATFQIYRRRD